jgi:hypothetical protein
MVSVRKTSMSSVTHDWPRNSSSPAIPMGIMFMGLKKKTT